MEARSAYGWGGSGVTDAETLKTWVVGYVFDDGGHGETGITFRTKEEAELFAMEKMRKCKYIKQTIVRHPKKTYSTY